MHERLQEIKRAYGYGHILHKDTHPYWLIARVEELEEQVRVFEMKYENTGSIFNRSHQIDRIETLQEENQCYKQALEDVRSITAKHPDLVELWGITDKTLKESEWE